MYDILVPLVWQESGEAPWLPPPTLARHHSTICVSHFTTGYLSKEHGTNKPPATGKVQEKSDGDATSPTTSENPTLSWATPAPPGRTQSQNDWPEKTWKRIPSPESPSLRARSRAGLLSSLTCRSPALRPGPMKSVAFSARVSLWTVHLPMLDKSPLSGPGRGPHS